MMFKPLNLEAKDDIVTILNEHKSISCELCFGNLFVWSGVENTEYYIQDNILYLRSNAGYYFPSGFTEAETETKIENLKKAVVNILEFEPNAKFNNLVSEQADFLQGHFHLYLNQKMNLRFTTFKITHRPDKSEYIYDADKLRTFAGRKLHSKKNHLNKFYSLYGNRFKYENIGKNNIKECLELSWEWRDLNELYLNNSILTELDMVKKFIDNYDKLDLCGGCIKIDGEIKAFTIGERAFADSDCVIIHVEKAMYHEIEGIYPAICSMFLTAHPEFNLVNREDDLGDEGLRKSKLSYRPEYLLGRFEAELLL
jgi:hypothetical protein